jgi:2-phospho-L-lactate/phosphoenolpyruvate guanylyltransferase
MRTAAVLPVKRFDAAKQRLERGDRGALMRDMAAGVLAALRDADGLEHVVVVTADGEAASLARAHGFVVVDEGPRLRGHSAAAALGVAHAEALGAERVLLVAGDCPLLHADDVDALLARHTGPGVVVLADRHGTGTNALLIAPPRGIGPAFGPGSRARHEALAAAAGLPCVVEAPPAFAYDVDTVADLAAVRLLPR